MKLIAYFILFLSCLKAYSQNLEDIKFDLMDEEDGLSSHFISDVGLDTDGYLWVGTYDGLNRYDGNNFKIYRHNVNDSMSILHNNQQKVFIASNGEIWISYREGGFSKFDKKHESFQNFSSSKTGNKQAIDEHFSILSVEQNNSLWFSGTGHGLKHYDTRNDILEYYDLPFISNKFSVSERKELNTVLSLYEDPNGLAWLCTMNGLYSFDKKTKKFIYKPCSLISKDKNSFISFNKLMPEGNSGFWISSFGGGMYYYDLKTERFANYLYETKLIGFYNLISDILVKSDDELWVVTADRGLGIFNKRTGLFQFNNSHFREEINKFPFLTDGLITPNNVMFLGGEDGLWKANLSSKLFNFKFLPIAKSQHGDIFTIRKIIENPDLKEEYFATDNGDGLNILNTVSGKLTAISVEVNKFRGPHMKLLNLNVDPQNRMWLLTRDYLFEFDPKRKILRKLADPFILSNEDKNLAFKATQQDKEGNLWILMENGDLHPFSSSKQKLLQKINSSHTIDMVLYYSFDSSCNIWLFGDAKLGYFNIHNNQFTAIQDKNILELIKEGVKGMSLDSKGNVWIAINEKGLLKIDASNIDKLSYKLFTLEQGLPLGRINQMGIDYRDNLWMATVFGVIYLNAENNSFRLFNQSVGMDRFTIGIRFFKSNNNSFYITSPGRYCKVNYEDLNRNIPEPKVYIDKFKVFNAERNFVFDSSEVVQLKSNENFFSFDFGCIDFANQKLNRFAYMLEGWDKEWIISDSRRYASYTNIEGGDYTFKVKVANIEGTWGESISLPIFIQTPFYKQWWFLMLVISLFTLLIYKFYQYRIDEIEKGEGIKTEFNKQLAETRMEALRAQMNPHFIFNCLNSINRYIIKSDIKTSSLYLTRFAKLIRLILDNSKHKKILLSNELEALKLYIELEAFRFEKKFTFEISVDEDIVTEAIEVPPLIIQPFVENAIWHGLLHKESAGHLEIMLHQSKEILTIEVTDDGIGRVKSQEYKSQNTSTRKSVGIRLTEERLNYFQGEISEMNSTKIIDLYDNEGNASGTKIIIYIKI